MACLSFSYSGLNIFLYRAVIYQAFLKLTVNSLFYPCCPLYALLSPGVGFLIGAPDMFGGKMGVNLCGRDVSVTQ